MKNGVDYSSEFQHLESLLKEQNIILNNISDVNFRDEEYQQEIISMQQIMLEHNKELIVHFRNIEKFTIVSVALMSIILVFTIAHIAATFISGMKS